MSVGATIDAMFVTCRHCEAKTFTITGWADLDHCSECGHALAVRDPLIQAATVRRLTGSAGSTRPANPRDRTPAAGSGTSHS